MGFSSGVRAFLRAPFLGFFRRFVGLAHVVFYHISWPRSSCFRFIVFIDLSSSFLRFLAWLPLRSRLSLGSPLIAVRSSDASGFSFPGLTNQRPARMGVSLFVFYVDDGDSLNFFVFVPHARIPRISVLHVVHAMPRHAMLRLCVVHHTRIHSHSRGTTPPPSWPSAFDPLALFDALQGPQNTVASQGPRPSFR